MKTHKTRPDMERDPIQLKNLIKVAEEMVNERFDKRFAASVLEPLKKLAEETDLRNNLDSLLLFANENFTEAVKLDIPVVDKVLVGQAFMIRDLLYTKQMQYRYYILVLGKAEARLLEAINNRLIKEFKEPFPIMNTKWFPEDMSEKTKGMTSVQLLDEYFKVVDKQLNNIVQENEYPVIVCTEASNYPEYNKIVSHPDNIVGHLPLSMVPQDGSKIVQAAWEVASEIMQKEKLERLEILERARSANNYLADINEIYKAIQEGRGRILFVRTDFNPDFQLEEGEFVPVSHDNNKLYRTIDPIDLIIRELIEKSGEVVFIPNDADTDFNGMALVTRY